MIDTAHLSLFLAATLALNLTPGPDMLYVIARSLSQGRSAGIVSALGIGAGCLVHMLAAAFGLSAVLMSSAVAFEAVKWAGAAYLVFLGVRAVLSGASGIEGAARPAASLARVFREGVATNVLNPKVALFFLAFLPQFVNPARGGVATQVLMLGLLFNTSGTLVNVGVALLAGSVGRWASASAGASRAQRWFTGGVFVALGVRLALAGRR
jgi:threonine/homoserine/homoserine lactone efflux protein